MHPAQMSLEWRVRQTPAQTDWSRVEPFGPESAARMDGASEWQVFWKVKLPLVRLQLAIVSIYTAICTARISGKNTENRNRIRGGFKV